MAFDAIAPAASLDSPVSPPLPAKARVRKSHTNLLFWLLGTAVLCAGLGLAPVSRTQEARVLETAREMLGSEAHNWLVPRVNGRVRLQKPPLAYWLTAFAFAVFDVSEGTGRIPAALAGWLAVGVTGATASWLFGRRAGFFAGATLLGSYLFFRHSRLAETDVLVTLFVTAAVAALWRGFALSARITLNGTPGTDRPSCLTLHAALWYHAAAVAIGLAVVSKGPPAAYPVLFFVALACVERKWKPLLHFHFSGAPLTAAAIALPWFAYVARDPMVEQLTRDLQNSAGGGRGHGGLFITYLPKLFVATAPWSALWVVALVAAVRTWRDDHRLRGLVIWIASILLPLFGWGNKQFHYLMPVMPPLMILVGWLLDESLKAAPAVGQKIAPWTRRLLGMTAIAFAAAAPGLIIAGKWDRGHLIPADFAAAALVLATLGSVAFVHRRRGPAAGLTAFAVGNVLILLVLVGLWAPSLNAENIRAIPPALATRYGDGPFALVGKEDLPLVFHMRRTIPVVRTDAEIAALVAQRPDVVAIEPLGDRGKSRPAIAEEARFRNDETVYRVGRINPAVLAGAGVTTIPATSAPTFP